MAPKKNLEELMDPSWAKALAPVEGKIRELGDFLRQEAKEGKRYLPAPNRIFRAFSMPMDEVKVLIVGQDPYPTPGDAVGLAFSVEKGSKIPKSLQNIYQEMKDDIGACPDDGDLSFWASQGVLLLNRCLTVREGIRASHKGKGWEEVTKAAVEALVKEKTSEGRTKLVAILWGKPAASLKPELGSAVIIESSHPSPLSCHMGFFGSRPFSRANKALEEMGLSPIDWSGKGKGI
ncbi:MAG: uracil-DNA glycosylase [Bifidobacteriaceae bacterium]|nr:uracil-DNA glycosylase [Bifidobacteriaceae bacterium]